MMSDNTIVHADDRTFESEVLKSDLPALVDFWAPWCGPCHIASPVIEDLSREYQGSVKFVKVNVDNAKKTAKSLSIMSIPTIMVFSQGKVLAQRIGVQPKDALEEMIRQSITQKRENHE